LSLGSLFASYNVSFVTWKKPQIAENVSTKEIHSDFFDVLLVLLDPYARKVINKEYPSRSYALWDAEILEIKRLTGGYSQYDFTVKVKYDTYTGPFIFNSFVHLT